MTRFSACWTSPYIWLIQGLIVASSQPVTILPYPSAVVEQYNTLTIVCSCSTTVRLLSWIFNDNEVVSLLPQGNGSCLFFSGLVDDTSYQYTCNQNMFTLTIWNVTEKHHSGKWRCSFISESHTFDSESTSVYVQVPVKSIKFSSPAEDMVYVNENLTSRFRCVTSAERPRSMILWYMRGRSESIGTGTVTPNNKDLLSITTSLLSYKFSRTENTTELYCTAVNTVGDAPVVSNTKTIFVRYGTDGGPVIVGFSNGSTFQAIESIEESLTCFVTGGNPPPTLSWDCFSGSVTDTQNNPTEVRQTFTWTPLIGHGRATCSCISFQTVSGQQIFTLIVDVLYSPSKPALIIDDTMVTGTISVIRGRNLSVKCEASGKPTPSYEWTDSRTSRTTNGQSLNIGDTKASDEGTYTCTASNTMQPSTGNPRRGKNFAFFLLDILYPPEIPKFRVEQQILSANLSIVRGDNISVKCESASDPGPPIIQWIGQAAGNSVLTTLSMQSTNAQTCTARNVMSPTVGASESGIARASLTVFLMWEPTAPKLEYMPTIGSSTELKTSELVVIKGTNFSVRCFGSASIPGPPLYSWTGNKSSSLDSISFIEIGKQDPGGTSTCHVKNTMVRTVGDLTTGRNSASLEVKIHYPPDIDSFNEQAVVENAQLSIPCTARSVPSPSSYKWTRSKDDFYQQSSILNITHTRREDADKYTCTVQNKLMPTVEGDKSGVASGTVSVKILYFPDVAIYQPNGTNVREGDANVLLMCEANGNPNTYTFGKWTHFAPDGMTRIKEYTAVELEEGRVQLKFTDISYMDSGIFECNVSNGIRDYKTGNTFATSRATQTVKGPPILGNSERLVTAAIQTNATLIARYYSNDGTDLEVSWYRLEKNNTKSKIKRDGERIFYDSGSDNVLISFYDVAFYQSGNVSRLFVLNVTADDFQDYEIEISNEIGKTVSRIHFVLQNGEHTSASSLNVGATVGAATAAVMTAVATLVAVFFLLRRYRNVRVRRNEQKRDGILGFMNGHEYVNMNAPACDTVCKTGSGRTGENMRLPEQPYKSLHAETNSSSTYEELTAAKQNEIERSAASEYDLLDPERTNKHIYTSLEVEATTKPSKEERAKQRMNENTRRMRPKIVIDKTSEQNLGQTIAEHDAVYNNLMIRNA